jgi:hypothetical protein
MKKRALVVSISTVLLISGCASMGKEGRIGQNDGSDSCYTSLNSLDEMAIYYKDERMKSIATGALIGGATGVLAGMAAGRSDAAMIVGGVTGVIAGGFAADAYWKNKLQQANNQMDRAISLMEADLKQDADRLSRMDRDLAALIRCRTLQRDMIKKQYAEGKITLQQAQEEWKKWGALINKDQEEMQYLDEALVNIRNINDSYDVAATAIGSSPITEDMQTKRLAELKIERNAALAEIDNAYKKPSSKNKIKASEKKKLNKEKQQQKAKINNAFDIKEKSKSNPQGEKIRVLAKSAITDKMESLTKGAEKFNDLSVQAKNSFESEKDKNKDTDTGFEKTGKLFPIDNYADFFAYTPPVPGNTTLIFTSAGECKG